jgi:hypothetical protein
MIPDYKLCDKCGAKIPKNLHCSVATGSAWNGVETMCDWHAVEMCAICYGRLIVFLAKDDFDLGRKIVDWTGV